jgi:oxygen-independent coproporphyrinogen III oxidase
MTTAELFAKYDVPVPRYTSYPTVPQWHALPTADRWTSSLAGAVENPDASLALYVHVPFCESLCTFCGCNTVITRDHTREDPYVELVLAELDLYLRAVPQLARVSVRQIHLGGGTPTFLSPASLDRLMRGLADRLPVRADGFEGSVEVDPRVTTLAHLETLRARDMTRISLGVQDVDPAVQQLVNRIQPAAMTTALTHAARQLGYASVNFDLIYGLPGQTRDSMLRTIDLAHELAPDRLALFGYAHVPWMKSHQRLIDESRLPDAAQRWELMTLAGDRLRALGYVQIGFDHFACIAFVTSFSPLPVITTTTVSSRSTFPEFTALTSPAYAADAAGSANTASPRASAGMAAFKDHYPRDGHRVRQHCREPLSFVRLCPHETHNPSPTCDVVRRLLRATRRQ